MRDSDPRSVILWLAGAILFCAGVAWLLVIFIVAPTSANAGGQVGSATGAVRGVATWYDAPSRRDAAAGPALREALGPDWRGRWVTVESGGRSALVRLTDWCACGDRPGGPTVIDLDDVAFARLATLGTGVIDVVVSWESGPAPTLPPTDADEDPGAGIRFEGPSGPIVGFLIIIAVVMAPALHLTRIRRTRR